MSSSNIKFVGERLKRTGNLDAWILAISIFARRYGLYGYLLGNVPQPTTGDEEIAQWVQKDLTAQLILVSAVDEELLADIHASLPSNLEESTAALTYSAILQTFRPNIATHAIALHRHLANRRLQADEKILSLWADVTSTARQLCTMEGRTCDVGEVMKWMGSALGEDYDARLGTAAAMHRQKSLTMEDFRMLLIEREQELESRNGTLETEHSFSVTHNSPRSGGSSRSTSKPFPGTCFICNKHGHKAADCPQGSSQRGGDGERKGGGGGNRDGGDHGKGGGRGKSGKGKDKEVTFVNTMDHYVFHLPGLGPRTMGTHQRRLRSELLWDSGATRSMSWDHLDFSDIRPVEGIQVMAPGGKPLQVTGIGTLSVTAVDEMGETSSSIEPTNSLLAPDLNTKVVAHAVFAKKGCEIHGRGHDFEIWRGNSKVCGIERMTDSGLYQICSYLTHLEKVLEGSSRIVSVPDYWAVKEDNGDWEDLEAVSHLRRLSSKEDGRSMEHLARLMALTTLGVDVDSGKVRSGSEKLCLGVAFSSDSMNSSRKESTHLQLSTRPAQFSKGSRPDSWPVDGLVDDSVSNHNTTSAFSFGEELLDLWKDVQIGAYSTGDVPVWGSVSMVDSGEDIGDKAEPTPPPLLKEDSNLDVEDDILKRLECVFGAPVTMQSMEGKSECGGVGSLDFSVQAPALLRW
ncbi:hypothetical protein HDU93_009097, partial [Gonapodya sp. JEL0774]